MSSRKKRLPVFQLVAGISLDGRITDVAEAFESYASKEDQQSLAKKIAESDVLLMGRKTFEKHVEKVKKPMIVFSRQLKGIQLDKKDGHIIHWFNDEKEELMNLCRVLEYQTITILGGAEVYHWAISNKLATDLYITVEPLLFGDGKHLLEGELLKEFRKWKLQSSERLNESGTLLLHYRFP